MTMEIKDLMNRAKAAEKQRDEARQDCAVAERNHMIEVERRKAAEARAEKALERAKIQAFVVTEYCPHCDKEQSLLWDAGKDGYEIYCPTCGEKIMLCSVCGGKTTLYQQTEEAQAEPEKRLRGVKA